jgi:hypothetical protein
MKPQLVALLAAALLSATAVHGQVLYGSIVGNVSDSSGATVPGATVTITQLAPNQTRDSVTNEAGSYTFANVAAGTYQVVVSLTGFQTFTARGVVVQANRAIRVDPKLTVGAIEESLTVTAQQPLLQTETSAVQTQLTRQAIENIPVNGRSFQSLLVLAPGVAQPNYFQTGGINNPSRSMQISVNGAPNQNTVVRIDGVSATNQWIEGLQSYSPGMEAIENVNVVTSSFDADQGMAGGASVNVQVKSGTNRFQGLGFEYLTTAALRDRNYFLPPDQDKVKDDKNVFGGTGGGPIKKDKLFYFMSVESTVQRSVGGPYATQASGSATQFLSLPPTAIRGGDFSQTGTVIYDPLTGNANGTGRTPFPNNVIPANRINQVAKNVLALLPQPQYPGTANNYFALPQYNSDFHKIDTKVTWNASNKVNLNGGSVICRPRECRRAVSRRRPGVQSAGARHDAQLQRLEQFDHGDIDSHAELRRRRHFRVHAAAHISGAARSEDLLGRGTGDSQLVSAGAARLRPAAPRHRRLELMATACASTTTPDRCSTTSIRNTSSSSIRAGTSGRTT